MKTVGGRELFSGFVGWWKRKNAHSAAFTCKCLFPEAKGSPPPPWCLVEISEKEVDEFRQGLASNHSFYSVLAFWLGLCVDILIYQHIMEITMPFISLLPKRLLFCFVLLWWLQNLFLLLLGRMVVIKYRTG